MNACFRVLLVGQTDELDCELELRTETTTGNELLVAIRDATPSEVVGGELYLHFVTGENSDVVHPHFPGDVRQDLVAIFEFNPEHCVRE